MSNAHHKTVQSSRVFILVLSQDSDRCKLLNYQRSFHFETIKNDLNKVHNNGPEVGNTELLLYLITFSVPILVLAVDLVLGTGTKLELL